MSDARAALTRYARWMLDEALPFWASTGVDGAQGFVEALELDGSPRRTGFKRVRVHARQVYVFSHAHLLGVPGALAAANNGAEFLLRHGWGPQGGWVVKMGESGGHVDTELDLYDQAFVLLAMAWWHRASGDPRALEAAQRTLDKIDADFARPDGRGYLSRLPDRGEALQNPHMHLLEALLAHYPLASTPANARRIEALRRHFSAHLLDAETGTLGEYFAMDWTPEPGPRGDTVEPGHHYEWVWLLGLAERLGFGAAAPEAERLFAFAEAHGLTETGLIHDELARDGTQRSARHRSWPQTERLKALALRGEESGAPDLDAIATALTALMDHYLAPAPPGTWIDHVDATGAPCVDKIPASTLYHLFLAYAELTRVAPALFGDDFKPVDLVP
ncbi:AGE family epimerase/isomerase [Acidimangrovimonas pyrenivorans]|uniref:AGE family epimerase/isomerase n=1 Tax=Acidimangrovimonas pyrenivorans TaxID=2030798 RepID=A0ABV7ALM7_9RHOB